MWFLLIIFLFIVTNINYIGDNMLPKFFEFNLIYPEGI